MKFICEQAELAKILQITSKALATKSTLPILTGIYLEIHNNILKCLATNLELIIETQLTNFQVIKAGKVVIPGRTFVDIIKHLPARPVELEYITEKNLFNINCDKSSYQLNVLSAEEFPDFSEEEPDELFTIPGTELKEGIKQTIYATITDENRPFLSSILWEVADNKLRLVATDINRLALKDISVNENITKTALVPVRAMKEIASIFDNNLEEPLQIKINDKAIFIKNGAISFASRLVDTKFPKYQQVVPQEFGGSFVCDRSSFIEALERTLLVSSSVKINISDQGMRITSKEPDKGIAYEEVSIDFTGVEMEIGFNVKFLLEFLRSITSEKVIVKYIQEQKPVLMQGQTLNDYLYIVMPLKLAN